MAFLCPGLCIQSLYISSGVICPEPMFSPTALYMYPSARTLSHGEDPFEPECVECPPERAMSEACLEAALVSCCRSSTGGNPRLARSLFVKIRIFRIQQSCALQFFAIQQGTIAPYATMVFDLQNGPTLFVRARSCPHTSHYIPETEMIFFGSNCCATQNIFRIASI